MRSPLEFPDLLLLNLEDDHPWEPLPLFATPSYSSPPGEKKKKKINFRFDFVQAIDLAVPIILSIIISRVDIGS